MVTKCETKASLPREVTATILCLHAITFLCVSIYSLYKIKDDQGFKKANCCNKIIKYTTNTQQKIKKKKT